MKYNVNSYKSLVLTKLTIRLNYYKMLQKGSKISSFNASRKYHLN